MGKKPDLGLDKRSLWIQQSLKVFLAPDGRAWKSGVPVPMGGPAHTMAKMFAAWVLFNDIMQAEHEEAAEINARMNASKLTYHEPKKAFKSKWAEKHGAKHAGVRRHSPLARLSLTRARRRMHAHACAR